MSDTFVVLLQVHLHFPDAGSLKAKRSELNAVKAHLRVLFQKFGIQHLAQNQKRGRLVELAMQGGAVSERDLTRS